MCSHAAYYLQLGAFKTKSNAQQLSAKAQAIINHPVSIHQSISHGNPLYVVRVGPFKDVNDAKKLKQKASQAKLTGLVVSHKQTSKQPKVTPVKKEQKPVHISKEVIKIAEYSSILGLILLEQMNFWIVFQHHSHNSQFLKDYSTNGNKEKLSETPGD